MWKWTRKDEKGPTPLRSIVPPERSIPSQESVQYGSEAAIGREFPPEVTRIGKSVVIRGDISGGGNVYLDGEIEGKVELSGSFTVGPEGRVRANLQACSIVVEGRVEGNLYGLERAELKKSATVVGDIYTPRIVIEDGAFLEGSVRVHKDIVRPRTKKEDAAA